MDAVIVTARGPSQALLPDAAAAAGSQLQQDEAPLSDGG